MAPVAPVAPATSRPCLAVVQYDGAQFVGWQRQREGRTVQADFEAVLERLMGRRTPTTGAGRTDTGVHALGQGVGFAAAGRWSEDADGLRRALNALLPRDVWVARVHRMHPGFHARKSAVARRYRYVIGSDEAAHSPFRRPYEWALGRELDQAALRQAAAALVGEHDFRGLAAAGQVKPHYRSRVALAEWAPRTDGAGVTLRSRPTGFCIAWCASWWARWSTSPWAGALRRTSPVCSLRRTTGRPARPRRPRGCT